MPEQQPQYLHEEIGKDDTATATPSQNRIKSQLDHHLAGLETWLDTIEERIDEVRRAADGKDIQTIVDGGPDDQAIAAGRLLEAVNNAVRSSGQIYALCALMARNRVEATSEE
jgi:hypothetical protein